MMYTYLVLKKINIGYLSVVWAVFSLTVIFTLTFTRLAPHSVEALRSGLTFGEQLILLAWCSFMLFTEGYLGFQKKFSPRFAARALYLFKNPSLATFLLAPVFCIGFINTPRKRKLSAGLLILGIFVLVFAVKHVPQPWRGIIDTGVILGLTYGLLSVYSSCIRAITTKKYAVDPEVALR